VSEIRSEPIGELEPVLAAGAAAADEGVGRTDDRRPHWLPFLGIAGLILVLDQLSKAWLVSFLAPGRSVDVIGDWIRLVHSQNNGGLFGILRNQALPFGLVSLVVVAVIVVYHARAGRSRYLSITLGLLLGGALGNLTDRLRLGYVVDFVDAGIGGLRWYTFNVADAGISFAILLLIAASVLPSVARRAAADA
jgi:signal peptidase II